MNKRQLRTYLFTAIVAAVAIACSRIFPAANAPFFISLAIFAIVYGTFDVWNHRTNDAADIRVNVRNIDTERYKSLAYRSGRDSAIKAIQQDHPGISKAHARKLWHDIIDIERSQPSE